MDKTDKPNVVFLVNNLNSGGIENYLLRFLKKNYHNFYKVFVYCKSGQGGQLESQFLEVPNIEIVKSKIGYLDYKGFRSFFNFLISKNISITCDFTGNFSGVTLMISYIASIPKRVAFYRSSSDRFKKDFMRNTYNLIINFMVKIFATDILSNSKTALNKYFKGIWLNNPKFEVIYNGLDANEFLNISDNLREQFEIPSSAFVIGHTGRFNPAKNHSVIVKVAENLIKKYDDIYFIMCGNGVKENLSKTLTEKGLVDRVLVFENRSDIPKFLNTMDCYFFPSITEGQPNSLIEAMAVGLPYVASNIEPIKETALSIDRLYNPNDIDSFVLALESIYKSKSPRDLDLQNKVIKKFDYKTLFNKFYERLKV